MLRSAPPAAMVASVILANVLWPLIDAEEWTLETLHAIGLGWGLAIVCLTLVVRGATVPLTVRQLRSQQRLAVHAPELKRLGERHADDPARLRQEMLAYYREHGIDPLASFLPLLLQIPVFVSLFFLMREALRNGVFEHAGFLFIPDLTAKPHGLVLLALVAAYAASQVGSALVATRTLASGHRKAAIALPLLFVGAATRFPAGLLVYWVTSGLWGLGQQLVLWRWWSSAGADQLKQEPLTEAAASEATCGARPKVHPRSKKKRGRRGRR